MREGQQPGNGEIHPSQQQNDGDPPPREVSPGATWPLDYEGDFNFAALGLLLALLFIGAALYSMSDDGPTLDSLIYIGGYLLLPCVIQIAEQIRDLRFRVWIVKNWDEFHAGEATLDGRSIDLETQLVRYRFVLSMFFVQTSGFSRPVLPGSRAATISRWASTFVTCTLGWWSVPFGPFRTVAALRVNLLNRPSEVSMRHVAEATIEDRPLGELHLDA